MVQELLVTYGGRFQAFLAYFPSISHLFLHYFPKNFPFPKLFLIYFTVISHFSIISHLFPNYFSFPVDTSRFSVTLPNYFSVTSRLFPSENSDNSAIYNWLTSALTNRRLLHGVTKIGIIISRALRGVLNGSSRLPRSSFFCR